jgi:integrase
MQSEVLTLTLSQVDFSAGTLRINPGGSKTGEGRVVYLSAEVRMLVEEQLERVRTLSRKLGRVIPYLFPHLTAGHFQGERIRDFRKSWPARVKQRDSLACCGMTSSHRREKPHPFGRPGSREHENHRSPHALRLRSL